MERVLFSADDFLSNWNTAFRSYIQVSSLQSRVLGFQSFSIAQTTQANFLEIGMCRAFWTLLRATIAGKYYRAFLAKLPGAQKILG